MKKTIFKTLILGSIWMSSVSVMAQQFIDCSNGNKACDVLYASDEIFVGGANNTSVQTGTNVLLKTNDKPLAESKPVDDWATEKAEGYRIALSKGAALPVVEPTGNLTPEKVQEYRVVLPEGASSSASRPSGTLAVEKSEGYRVVLPKGATISSEADAPVAGTVVVPNKRSDSRVDVLPDGSVQTTTVEITTEATPEGYQETTRRIERLDTEKQGAVWVEKSLTDKVEYGDAVHDWEASRGETLRSLLMQWGEVSGWTVIWKLDKDYKLEAGVVFRGTFTEVASAIIRTFARAVPAPIGTFYKGNRVLVVSIQEDENAH